MDNNEGTILSYGDVKTAVETIRDDCLVKMRNIFDNFNSSMNILGGSDAYVGDASETFQSRYNKLKVKFQEFENLINEFADKFAFASASTAQTEKELANESQNLDTF